MSRIRFKNQYGTSFEERKGEREGDDILMREIEIAVPFSQIFSSLD